jgi:hypothetical protein
MLMVIITRVISAVRKDIDAVLLSVLLSGICKGYIIIYYLLCFMYFVCLHYFSDSRILHRHVGFSTLLG